MSGETTDTRLPSRLADEMTDAERIASIKTTWGAFHPVGWDDGIKERCPACRAPVGGRHEEGCDWERCPHCGDQTISCGNCQDHLAGEVLPWVLNKLAAAENVVDAARALVDGVTPIEPVYFIEGDPYCVVCGSLDHSRNHEPDCEWMALVAALNAAQPAALETTE